MEINTTMKCMLACVFFSTQVLAMDITANESKQVQKYIGDAEIFFNPGEKFEIEADSITEEKGRVVYSGNVSVKALREIAANQDSDSKSDGKYLKTITVDSAYMIAKSERVTLYRLESGGTLLKSDEYTVTTGK
ncbi:hypothetical protein PO80_12495 [Vibrio parahaemolyticus]|uniref:hypothetical protein n=1 Tax=Vibrio parahaemolyticus TaxID=670 RepID=UPI00054339F3|nr:hypothetical protein [Vibrio parahaemolyticus]ELU8564342.1 hypothetical protein [Vibrio parahaemolyticus]KHF15225.1 hypothetical protein PO80_12495 [Vibrio parahaemolyticus]MDS1791587.1 hypothetical protein [Vibrio parahaemolyticus]OTV99034.1 hypothetical protein BA739_21505 [Vibrio parahaemolyticus]OTW03049.1 hypothetical protein BA740_21685 [Vibrio parahaemolyticus]